MKDKGSKLIFDDEGNAHQIYELEDEDAFKARGSAADQRQRFLDEEAQRVRTADLADKQLAKEKRRAKREKRKERDRAEGIEQAEEEGAAEAVDGVEDAMANFIADAEALSDGDEEEEEDRPQKKQKKWFQQEGRRKDLEEEPRDIETLDDLEAAAAEMLG